MILIDGSKSGGQVLRTATALSVLTNKPFKISNIRGSRENSGLKTQHVEAVSALKKLSKARVKGLKLGSKKLEFKPKDFIEGDIDVKIPTAGSIGLLLQALMLATSRMEKINISIRGGGTWNKWAPPVVYLKRVLFPLLGEKSKINIIKDGFYPKGGAYVKVKTERLDYKKLNITEHGEILETGGFSFCSTSLRRSNVYVRQAIRAKRLIIKHFDIEPTIQTICSDTSSPGSGLLLFIKTTNSIIGADALGEMGKSSERVAEEATDKLIEEYSGGAIDSHAADMVLPYMALAGSGMIRPSKITEHIKNNITVIEQFLPVKFHIKEGVIVCGDKDE